MNDVTNPTFKQLDIEGTGNFNEKEFSDIKKNFQQKLRNQSILKIRKSIEENIDQKYEFEVADV